MTEEEIKIFDEWLSYIKERNGEILKQINIKPKFGDKTEFEKYENVKLRIINEYGFLEFIGDSKYKLKFTENGWDAARIGMKEYLNKISRADRKELFDFNISKWKYYTFWVLFVISVFGGLYSLYDATKRLLIQENEEQKQHPTEEKESEVSKSHTLILDQTNRHLLDSSSSELNNVSDSLKK